MRRVLLKMKISQIPFKTQVLYFFSITFFFAILFTLLFSFMELIIVSYEVDMDIYSILFVRTSIAFITLLIWNLIYFVYHYVERVRKEERDKAVKEKQVSELEAKALRAQMNPHFVFNILNTIESYALENNKEVASEMIRKFSKLTRLVLENSMHQLVPFTDDWKALLLYIELEQMRYANKFVVHYKVDSDLEEYNYLIPPMMIQPFVENAIIHGLRNKQDHEGMLHLSAALNKDEIVIQVKDNGIGRAKAANMKMNNPLQKTSLGIKVTQDRIAIFNNLNQSAKAQAEIKDMPDGTLITILLPVNH